MSGLLFLASIFLNGFIAKRLLLHNYNWSNNIPVFFCLGSFWSISLFYAITLITANMSLSFVVYSVLCIGIYIIFSRLDQLILFGEAKNKREFLLFLCFFIFSFYIMTKSFGYNEQNGTFLIASNLYLDFGAHIPFIRSFSMGSNIPAEVPFFAGNFLAYHLFYDFYVSLFEFLGWRIDMANNVASSIGFACLLYSLYEFGKLLFKSKIVGLISVLLFIFPPSLSFISFIQSSGNNYLSAIWHNSFYLADSPLGKDMVAVFWNLNTYLNQRQMIFGFLFLLIFLMRLFAEKVHWTNKEILFWSLMLAGTAFWHFPSFIVGELFLFMLLVINRLTRKIVFSLLILSCFLVLPYLLFIKQHSLNSISFRPGFLLYENFTFNSFVLFWISNLGISLLTTLVGFITASKFQKKVFLFFIPLFIMPNIFQFSRDMFDNHKFFNIWIISLYVFSAQALFFLWRNFFIAKLLSGVLFAALIFSGLINFFVIKNDIHAKIIDYPHNRFLRSALALIDNQNISITNGEIYDPISLLGKKTFVGRPHFIYAYGGDPSKRIIQRNMILSASKAGEVRKLLIANNITYVVLYKDDFAKNIAFADIARLKEELRILYEDNSGIILSL